MSRRRCLGVPRQRVPILARCNAGVLTKEPREIALRVEAETARNRGEARLGLVYLEHCFLKP